jgi:glycosyltransferase involved in cell wall biosynthesis
MRSANFWSAVRHGWRDVLTLDPGAPFDDCRRWRIQRFATAVHHNCHLVGGSEPKQADEMNHAIAHGGHERSGVRDHDAMRGCRGMSRAPGKPVIVAFPFVGGFVGGSHLSAAKLIQNLDRRRYQPVVILHRTEGQVADMFRDGGIAFEPAPSARFLDGASLCDDTAFVLTQTLRLARFLRRRGARIVHTNDGRTHATWALPTRLAGARLLWHHRKDPDAKGLRYVAPWAADRVVSVSRFSAPRPGLLSPARKCMVVHSPFDTDAPPVDRARARGTLIEELRCAPDARVVGFFGSLTTRKRPLTFVDAIAEMRARAPDLPLAAPIFGQDRQDLSAAIRQRAVARGVADCVHIMGFRHPPEPWMAACDVLLVPAVDEPFGRTLIEAMLLGTVVVAAASGGNPEAIRDGVTGHLVAPDDAAAFAQRTLGVLADPARKGALAEAARRDALERFGLRQHAAAIMRVYDTMLSPQGANQAAGAAEHEQSAIEPAGEQGGRDDAGPAPRSIQLTP